MDVVVRRLLVLVMVCIAFAACSGGGGGSPAPAAPAAPGAGGATPTPTPSGGATPTPTPRPSTSPTATPTASPTATASPSPNPSAAIAAACLQSQAASASGISPTTTTAFLNTVVATGRKICMSAYVFTNVAFTALDMAAKNHATVVVVFPAEEQSYYQSDLNQLQADGATIVIDPGASGSPAVNPIHAKLAIVDGNAYLDGHNWVEAGGSEPVDDVIIEDTIPNDFTAIETALTNFNNPPSSASGTLDLVKANSLAMEATFLDSHLPGPGVTVSYMTESFSSGAANVVSALEAARANGATVNVILVGSDETGSSDESLIDTMQADGITFYSNATTGSEKLLMISSLPGELWYGSSNSTSTSSLSSDYIDWGMLISDPTTISAISAYYQAQLSHATPLANPF